MLYMQVLRATLALHVITRGLKTELVVTRCYTLIRDTWMNVLGLKIYLPILQAVPYSFLDTVSSIFWRKYIALSKNSLILR